MATCKIESFIIGNTSLIIDKSRRAAMPDGDADKLNGYSLIDCSLTKELLKPNEFTFNLSRDKITKTTDTENYSIINSLIGKKVECEVSTYLDNAKTSNLHFVGNIQKVSVKNLNVTCIAYTDDYDLQGPPKCRCFLGKKLCEIVTDVASGINNLKVEINPYFDEETFPFIVQYNESDFDFLVQLAKRFGAFMYDNSSSFRFGMLPEYNFNHVKDLKNSSFIANYEFQTSNPNFRFVAHEYEKGIELDSQGKSYDALIEPSTLFKKATDASSAFDGNNKYRIDYPDSLPVNACKDVVDYVTYFTVISDSNKMASCRFVCYLLDLEVGDIVTIDDNGKMLVSAVHLTWNCNGVPQNEVTAILLPRDDAKEDEILAPYMDFNAYPKSSAQRAVVFNNVDPMKMGRVQVLFVWQNGLSGDDKKKLPWIRVAQPYGGNEKGKDQGQGCYILPEIGEDVMVGFEHENLEKPFVIGTLYHGSDPNDNKTHPQKPEESWVETDQVNKKNEVKAFRTKKGHTIEFHDVDGDNNYGFIRIYGNDKKDQPNYDIILSTDPIKTGNNRDQAFKVKSADNELQNSEPFLKEKEYEVKELRIMVRSNGGDIVLDAGEGDLIMNAKNIRVHASGERTALIEGKDIVKVKDNHWIETKNTNEYVGYNRSITIKNRDTYNASALNLGVSDDISISAKNLTSKTDNKMLLESSQKTEIKAMDIQVKADQNATIKATSEITINGDSKVDLSTTSLNIEGRVSAHINSYNLTLGDNKAMTNLKGFQITLDPSGIGTRKGIWKDG